MDPPGNAVDENDGYSLIGRAAQSASMQKCDRPNSLAQTTTWMLVPYDGREFSTMRNYAAPQHHHIPHCGKHVF
jgi:hypothetical protein